VGKRPQSPRFGHRFGHWFFHSVLRLLGPVPAYLSLHLVVPFYVFVLKRPRRLASAYLCHRFPEDTAFRRFFRTYIYIYRFGQVLIDQAAMGILGPEAFSIEFEDRDKMYRMSEQEKGLLLMTSHVGNWQTAMGTMNHLAKVVYFHLQLDAHMQGRHFFDIAGKRDQIRFISPLSFMGGLVEAYQALEAGNILSMMGDRAWGSKVQRTHFLGERAPFPITPYRLAVKAGVPVVLMLTVRTGKLAFRIETSYLTEDKDELSEMDRDDAVTLLLKRYVNAIEKYTARYPYMWFNIFDFWSEQPSRPERWMDINKE